MTNLRKATAFSIGLFALAPLPTFAHAFLDHAVPGVGATVSGSPGELQLTFTEGVVVALCGVRVAAVGGGAVSVAKPTGNGKESDVLRVHLGKPLKAGTYAVNWHVVAVDSHPTSGSFKFTVAP